MSDVFEVIERRKLTPANVEVFLSVVSVLNELAEYDGDYGDTAEGAGDAVEMFWDDRDPGCAAIRAAVESKGMRVVAPTYDTGWARIVRGPDFQLQVSPELVRAYLEAIASGGRRPSRLAFYLYMGGVAAAVGLALALVASGALPGGLGIFVPGVLLVVAVVLGLRARGDHR